MTQEEENWQGKTLTQCGTFDLKGQVLRSVWIDLAEEQSSDPSLETRVRSSWSSMGLVGLGHRRSEMLGLEILREANKTILLMLKPFEMTLWMIQKFKDSSSCFSEEQVLYQTCWVKNFTDGPEIALFFSSVETIFCLSYSFFFLLKI